MIVDDSDLMRLRLRALLREVPGVHLVAEAATAEAAQQMLPGSPPDIMILDLRLPDSSGLDVLRAARTLPHPPRVIILTDYGYDMLRQRCRAAGADAFLEKGTEFDRLPEVIDALRPIHA